MSVEPEDDDLDDVIDFSPRAWREGKPDEENFWKSRGSPVADSLELDRVLAIARRPRVDPTSVTAKAIVELETARYRRKDDDSKCRCMEIDPDRGCIKTLLPLQAIILREARLYGGVFANAAAGGGKTFCDILAIIALGARTGVLLFPSNLGEQLKNAYQLMAQHWVVPSFVIYQGEKRTRFRNVVKDRHGNPDPSVPILYAIPSDIFSRPKMALQLENLNPDAIIIDESDQFNNLTSSRGIRLMVYMSGSPEMTSAQRRARSETKVCAWTGSPSTKSLLEMWHLVAACLKFNSPLPLKKEIVMDWDRCLGAVRQPCPGGALERLCAEGEDVYEGFHRRLIETPGFLSVQGAPVITAGGALVRNEIRERPAPKIPDIIVEALEKARDWKRPDSLAGASHDEQMIDVLEQAKVVRQVASGMFYYWYYPRGEPRELVDRWLLARKNWRKVVRLKKLRGERHLDSEFLIECAAKRAWGELPKEAHLPEWRSPEWPPWSKVKDLVKPQQRAYRLHPYLVEDAAQWAAEEPGIVWYTMVEFAQWLHELSGIKVCGGGPHAEREIMRQKGDASIAASVDSHGRGRDKLQDRFHRQLLAQVMASDRRYEQLLARLKRRGQQHEVVSTEAYLHTPELRKSFEQALHQGNYVQRTFGDERQLLEGVDRVLIEGFMQEGG